MAFNPSTGEGDGVTLWEFEVSLVSLKSEFQNSEEEHRETKPKQTKKQKTGNIRKVANIP